MPSARPEQPTVSVVMPVYNRARFVADAIRSFLDQTLSPLEVIPVVDEGSQDDSARVVQELAASDSRIRPLFLPHGSQWRARNAGVAMARGEYIAHMDDDDVALPDRLAAQMDWMRQTGTDLCGGCVARFGDADGIIWFPETHQAICHELVFRIGVLLPTLLVRTEIARAHPYEETVYSDYAMLTQVAHRYRLGNMPKILLKCRYHSAQIHVRDGASFESDECRYRRPYFHALFPDATAGDFRAVAQVAEKTPFTSLIDLKRAGRWLVRLAQTPDRFLCQQQAARWQAACQRSSRLGLGCYRVFRRISHQFGHAPRLQHWKVLVACTLRLSATSRWKALGRRIAHG